MSDQVVYCMSYFTFGFREFHDGASYVVVLAFVFTSQVYLITQRIRQWWEGALLLVYSLRVPGAEKAAGGCVYPAPRLLSESNGLGILV